MSDAWIIDACRTPRGIGKVGKGALADIHPQQLGATVLSAIRDRNQLDTRTVDDVIFGTSMQVGTQGGDLARMALLDAGYDTMASGVTLDRFCGSGITTTNIAAAQVMSGMEDVIIAGGCEMMSLHPALGAAQAGVRAPLMDAGNLRLRARHPQTHQGVAADAIASLEQIPREALDQLAYVSQQRAARAIAEGRFDRSLVPVYKEDGSLALDREEFPRPQTTLEGLAQLAPSFGGMADIPLDAEGTTLRSMVLARYPGLDITHVHHAGNSSGVVDGAAAVLIASNAAVKANGWTPRARIVATANMGDDPTLMLNAPVPAARKVLAKAGLSVDDIDLWEINEAFATVPMKTARDLGVPLDRVNVNGGAIALGHPLGATGAIILGTALDELERTGKATALATLCIGAGMGIATVIERV